MKKVALTPYSSSVSRMLAMFFLFGPSSKVRYATLPLEGFAAAVSAAVDVPAAVSAAVDVAAVVSAVVDISAVFGSAEHVTAV